MIARRPDSNFALYRGWWPMALAWLVLTVTFCIITPIRAESSSDFRDYWRTAAHFRETGEISAELGVHNYLPFFTIFMTPLSYFPLEVGIVVFTVISMVLLGVTIVLTEALLNGGLGAGPRGATWLALGLMLAYIVSSGVLGAVDTLVLFLVVATWFLFEHKRLYAAGVPLGLAIVIKLLPAVLVVFFLVKLRWRTAASAIVTAAVLGLLLPLLSVGYERTVQLHREYVNRAVLGGSSRATLLDEKPQKAKYTNNALPIVLRRLLTPTDAHPSNEPEKHSFFVNFADLPRPVVYRIYLGLLFAALVGAVAVAVRGYTTFPPTEEREVTRLRAQFGAWCCLMLIASPLVWTRYLLYAWWPLAFMADRFERSIAARGRPDKAALAALGIWLLGVISLAWPVARAAGAQIATVVVLFIALLPIAIIPIRRAPTT